MLITRKLLTSGPELLFRIMVLFLLVVSGLATAQQARTKSSPLERRIIFTVVEQPPEFPGGAEALHTYLKNNVKYPKEAGKKFRDKTVFTRFIITETGAIDSVRVLKPGNDLVDSEAVRVIQNMPAWKPGKQNGHLVAVWYNVPVHFDGR